MNCTQCWWADWQAGAAAALAFEFFRVQIVIGLSPVRFITVQGGLSPILEVFLWIMARSRR